jgi:hypothetical protein
MNVTTIIGGKAYSGKLQAAAGSAPNLTTWASRLLCGVNIDWTLFRHRSSKIQGTPAEMERLGHALLHAAAEAKANATRPRTRRRAVRPGVPA